MLTKTLFMFTSTALLSLSYPISNAEQLDYDFSGGRVLEESEESWTQAYVRFAQDIPEDDEGDEMEDAEESCDEPPCDETEEP